MRRAEKTLENAVGTLKRRSRRDLRGRASWLRAGTTARIGTYLELVELLHRVRLIRHLARVSRASRGRRNSMRVYSFDFQLHERGSCELPNHRSGRRRVRERGWSDRNAEGERVEDAGRERACETVARAVVRLDGTEARGRTRSRLAAKQCEKSHEE